VIELDPQVAERLFVAYAARYGGGSFPLAAQLAEPGRLMQWHTPRGHAVACVRRLEEASLRRDYAGREYRLPAGSLVASDIAREPAAEAPLLEGVDFAYIRVADSLLRTAMRIRGWVPIATRLDGGGLVTCFALPVFGMLALPQTAHDAASIGEVWQERAGLEHA
jgi:hypothetical protein